ncbi:exodeoxyribonuclease V subunit RecD [Vibrio crassostreae]|uniref:exodeoxyribonuclease V subunit alpha n=1 Tax=Vibrio crassostreae TaxID=246167 RepID=UPI001051B3F3|nr:exodeoxyribonuclease V subunit alpha [Vibrio crassostreae]TCN88110.1 DNA helicase/exodeoxyribonuclease V alpha subunit [Vibrio crassostreae]CAK2469265.1 exodeoxyribonuclease V subunit RecD [Vibrio crassostreae]CAK2563557.1 exodeoxyribonuclease V subunit RecD [Vibrio crassostreae]CAK3776927.1 exodeoxyribonuclease V subunit RecD [Vibrio crassostreae]CAK4011280.1 exodeoxyribonuclease V subunit RecD [Vibrio crassostreae]
MTNTSIETANTIKPVSLIPEQLMDVLKFLADKGSIRQLDYQFARFITQQATSHSQEIGFLAGVVSHELGKGHICTQLIQAQTADLAQLLGLYGETALQLNQKLLGIDWATVLQSSNLVGTTNDCVKPLMFDGQRVYLQRYWNYEVVLAETLNRLSKPVEFNIEQKKALTETLNQLFARSYHFLFNALAKAEANQQTSQVLRQQLVCDHLDIVDEQSLNWGAIDQAIVQAKQVTDLDVLDGLVPLSACLNWQKVAAAVALSRRFAVISGGPGTGKTTTVTKLLSAMVEQSLSQGKTPTIKLVAPTGKAAARLTESIGKAIEQLPLAPEVKANIPTESSTLHRLLGAIPNRAEFRHNRRNPLHLDILVVDEASMVDLSMMYKLVDALPEHARLILLGDKDQLASVEAGAVLGDICSFNSTGYSTVQGNLIAEMTGFDAIVNTQQAKAGAVNPPEIADSLCMLQKSYRFDARSGIGQLAKAINNGSANQVDQVFAKGFGDIENHPLSSDSYNLMLRTLVNEYGAYLNRMNVPLEELETQEARAKSVLDLFSQCRLLCSIREGDFGVKGLNHRIERALAARRLVNPHNDELWYHGRPVMVTRNDHGLGLYNGDIGICMLESDSNQPESTPRLKVYFELPDGSVKAVLPSRVPEHETAYAMTIHKSQGSEFDLTLMILPPDFSPILTRELIYTGITRAKKQLMMFSDTNVLKRGIKVKTERVSGLGSRLTS